MRVSEIPSSVTRLKEEKSVIITLILYLSTYIVSTAPSYVSVLCFLTPRLMIHRIVVINYY